MVSKLLLGIVSCSLFSSVVLGFHQPWCTAKRHPKYLVVIYRQYLATAESLLPFGVFSERWRLELTGREGTLDQTFPDSRLPLLTHSPLTFHRHLLCSRGLISLTLTSCIVHPYTLAMNAPAPTQPDGGSLTRPRM